MKRLKLFMTNYEANFFHSVGPVLRNHSDELNLKNFSLSGMKPTSGRIYEGGRVYTVRPGVGSNAGFMCRKVEGVTTAMKALLQDAKLMSREGKIDYHETAFFLLSFIAHFIDFLNRSLGCAPKLAKQSLPAWSETSSWLV